MENTTINQSQRFSIPSIAALISAVLSFATGPILGLFFAVVAIIAGITGIFLALSPRVRGGIASTLSLAAGAVGVIAAIAKGIIAIL